MAQNKGISLVASQRTRDADIVGGPTGRHFGEQDKASRLLVSLTSELLTTALFTVVATSCIMRRARNLPLKFPGQFAALLPVAPELFPSLYSDDPAVFFDEQLTAHLKRIYQHLHFALQMMPADCGEIVDGSGTMTTWTGPEETWRLLCGEMRMMMLILSDVEEVRQSGELARLFEIESLLKTATYGGSPCVRPDGNVVVPGWLDRRRERRIPIGISVMVEFGQNRQRVTMNDMSISGFGLAGCPSLASGTEITIEIPSGKKLAGSVAWSLGGKIGVRLHERLIEGSQMFGEIMRSRRIFGGGPER